MPSFAFDQLPPWVSGLGRVLFILAAAWLGTFVIRRLLRTARLSALTVMMRNAGGSRVELEKRAETVIGTMRKAIVTVVWSIAVVMSLREIGFDITPILAGAGVVGLAVGFGAQNLVRDVISGFFMLIENQIRVNDVAVVNGTGGLVEEINLRTTVLRSADGVVHVFPNGTITTLSNMTRGYSYYVFNLGVAYREDTDRVSAVLREVSAELAADAQFQALVIDPLEVMGVDEFTDSAVVIKARIKTQPNRQWTVGREMNRRIKKRFDELGIEIPFRQTTLHLDAGSRPIPVALAAPDHEQIKQIVRETLAELAETGRGPAPPGTANR